MKDVTDEGYADLLRRLEKTHRRLERYQREHQRLTYKRWVPEIRLDSAPEKLLDKWLDDESGYDEEAWPELKTSLGLQVSQDQAPLNLQVYRSASDEETWPIPSVPVNETPTIYGPLQRAAKEIADKLKKQWEPYHHGRCYMLSQGLNCQCHLCLIDELAEMADDHDN